MRRNWIVFALALMACLGIFATRNLLKESSQKVFGTHGFLLGNELSEDEVNEYCLSQGLNPKELMIYVAEYSVVNTGADFQKHNLPVYNPSVMKSILAVSSSLPLEEPEKTGEESVYLNADSKWLEKQPVGTLNEKLVVKYLMSVNNVDLLEESSKSLNVIKTSTGITNQHQNAGYIIPIMEALDAEYKNNKPSNLIDELKACVKWINNQISYPAEDIKDSLRGKVINLGDAEKTINFGMGVCTDNVAVLMAMLEYKGMKVYSAKGYLPVELRNPELLPYNSIGHETVLLATDQGYYLVDPTLQNAFDNEVMVLNNGMTVRGSKKFNFNEKYLSFPMFVYEIDGLPMEASGLVTHLDQLKIERVER